MGRKRCLSFLLAHNGSPAVLGMQDIDKLGLLSINHESKNRQVAEEKNKDNCKSPRQTKDDKDEQLKGEEQETGVQNTQDANNYPTVLGNNNKELIASLLELLIS